RFVGHKKAGQVPTRWSLRQDFVFVWMARSRADEGEPERIDEDFTALHRLHYCPSSGRLSNRLLLPMVMFFLLLRGWRFALDLEMASAAAPLNCSSSARTRLSSNRRARTSSRISSGQR